MKTLNSAPTENLPPQEECADYSYLDPSLMDPAMVSRDVSDINQFTLEGASRDADLFDGQRAINSLAGETEKAAAEKDRAAIHTLEEAAYTGVVSEGIMTLRGCHGCIKQACALKSDLEEKVVEGDEAMQGLLNIREKIMHRRFVRGWADNFGKYNTADKRIENARSGERRTRNLMFMGSLRDSFRDMLIQHVQPQGRDRVMRDINAAVPKNNRGDFASFSNGVAAEIFVYEELEQVVDKFTEAGREGCAVRFSNEEEDVKYGTDIVLTLVGKDGKTVEYAIDAKSRGAFRAIGKKAFGDSQYFGIKDVDDRPVYIVNPEGAGDEASYIQVDDVDGKPFASYSNVAKKGKFGSKIVSTLLKDA